MTVQLTVPHLKSNIFKESRCMCVDGGSLEMLDPFRKLTGRACSIYASLMTRWY